MKTLKIADLFCGAGGTSAGAVEAVELCGYRSELTAINHWEIALATHAANHPTARHLCTSIDDVNPRTLYGENELDILWGSPECTHHSIARGGRPMNDQSRATAWCMVRWAEALRPNIILVENVPEFASWGGIGTDGRPLKSKRGQTFRAWVAALESLGYRVDARVMCAADYGDPTTRTRLFVMAVRGKRRIIWPNPTHTRGGDVDLLGSRKPWVASRTCIDFSMPSQSIFERKRPLSEKTLARIRDGFHKFGVRPFVAAWDHQRGPGIWDASVPLSTVTTKARHGVVEPFLVELRGTSSAQVKNSARSLDEPVTAVATSGAHHAMVEPYLIGVAHGGPGDRARSLSEPLPAVCGNRGDVAICTPALLPQQSDGALRSVDEPCPTVATAGAIALVEPFLVSYYGNGGAQDLGSPLDTVTTKDRFGVVMPEIIVDGNRYLLDIHFRMLQPRELATAQGFRRDYHFTGNKTEQVKQIGNAVPRRLARAILGAALTQNPDVGWMETTEGETAA